MSVFYLNQLKFTYDKCPDMKSYFPNQDEYAWHCTLNTKFLSNKNLAKALDIWIAGNANQPNEELLVQALEIKNNIDDYLEESCLFDIQWIENVKLYSFYAGIEEIHNFRVENEWLEGVYLLDPQQAERCVFTETYSYFKYSTLFEDGHACDKMVG